MYRKYNCCLTLHVNVWIWIWLDFIFIDLNEVSGGGFLNQFLCQSFCMRNVFRCDEVEIQAKVVHSYVIPKWNGRRKTIKVSREDSFCRKRFLFWPKAKQSKVKKLKAHSFSSFFDYKGKNGTVHIWLTWHFSLFVRSRFFRNENSSKHDRIGPSLR